MKYPDFQKKLLQIVFARGRPLLQRKTFFATSTVILVAAFFYSIFFSALSARSLHFNHVKKEMSVGNYFAWVQAMKWNSKRLLTSEERRELHQVATEFMKRDVSLRIQGKNWLPKTGLFYSWQSRFNLFTNILSPIINSLSFDEIEFLGASYNMPLAFYSMSPFINESEKSVGASSLE